MRRSLSLTLLFAVLVIISTNAAGPTFRPDVVFRGSSLTGWGPMGDADWKAQNGEIIGTPKQPGGGWLVLDQSFLQQHTEGCSLSVRACEVDKWAS